MIDLNLLKAFDVLMDERSVTRAAGRLSLTQPAVSAILNRLRESFGDPLFVRTQRGILPTARALELEGSIKQILAEVESLVQPPSFVPALTDMTLTIAATDYALQAVVVPFLAALRQQAPNLRTAVLPVRHETLSEQLRRGDIDLALITPDMTPPELHARRLFDERYVCVMRQGHPDANKKKLSLDRFCALDHALVSYTGGGLTGVTDEALAKVNRQRRVTVSVTSFLVLPDILSTSDLIAVVPSRLANKASGLKIFEPPIAISGFTKTLVWHERTHRTAAHQWVRAILVETCGSFV